MSAPRTRPYAEWARGPSGRARGGGVGVTIVRSTRARPRRPRRDRALRRPDDRGVGERGPADTGPDRRRARARRPDLRDPHPGRPPSPRTQERTRRAIAWDASLTFASASGPPFSTA